MLSSLMTRIFPKSTLNRAPSYGLLQVAECETATFTENIARLAGIFNSVVVLWPEGISLPTLPSNVNLFTASAGLTNRWQLIKHCSDGFVFPISLAKSVDENHASRLKKHLFATGGSAAVGMFDFEDLIGATADSVDSAFALVPMPEIDVDYAVFDQRFWKLTGEEFAENSESMILSIQAFKRGFGLYACNFQGPLTNVSTAEPSIFSRGDLAESALRNPLFLERQNDQSVSIWFAVWDAMGIAEDAESLGAKEPLLKYLHRRNNLGATTSPLNSVVVDNEMAGTDK
jgi:hypothetical protein